MRPGLEDLGRPDRVQLVRRASEKGVLLGAVCP